MDMRDRWFSV